MRIQVNIPDDVAKRVDELAGSLGVSRSALCAIWISQGLNENEKKNGNEKQA